jgi:hypothetical protein
MSRSLAMWSSRCHGTKNDSGDNRTVGSYLYARASILQKSRIIHQATIDHQVWIMMQAHAFDFDDSKPLRCSRDGSGLNEAFGERESQTSGNPDSDISPVQTDPESRRAESQ